MIICYLFSYPFYSMPTPPDESKILIYLWIALFISIVWIFLSKKSKTKLGAKYVFIDYCISTVLVLIMLLTQIYFYYTAQLGSDFSYTVLLFQLTPALLFHGIFNIRYKSIIQDSMAYKFGVGSFWSSIILIIFLIVWYFIWGS